MGHFCSLKAVMLHDNNQWREATEEELEVLWKLAPEAKWAWEGESKFYEQRAVAMKFAETLGLKVYFEIESEVFGIYRLIASDSECKKYEPIVTWDDIFR